MVRVVFFFVEIFLWVIGYFFWGSVMFCSFYFVFRKMLEVWKVGVMCLFFGVFRRLVLFYYAGFGRVYFLVLVEFGLGGKGSRVF